ncbi:MAG TPA: hypothetical protein EYO58_09110, partial [Flavobacteriales bacterium]|nr:hypothetical protein [Flavobacteriales bacterium]
MLDYSNEETHPKTTVTFETISVILKLLLSGQINLTDYNRDCQLTIDDFTQTAHMLLFSEDKLANDLLDPIVLALTNPRCKTEIWACCGGLHRLIVLAIVFYGANSYLNQEGKTVRAISPTFKHNAKSREENAYVRKVGLMFGFNEEVQKYYEWKQSDKKIRLSSTADKLFFNQMKVIEIILQLGLYESIERNDGSCVEIENILNVQALVNNTMEVKYVTGSSDIPKRVNSVMHFHDAQRRSQTYIDSLKSMFLIKKPNSIQNIYRQMCLDSTLPRGTFYQFSDSILPAVLMSTLTIAQLEGSMPDMIPRKKNNKRLSAKEQWLSYLSEKSTDITFVGIANQISACLPSFMTKIELLYRLPKISAKGNLIKSELYKVFHTNATDARNGKFAGESRNVYVLAILLCLVVHNTLTIQQLQSFLKANIPHRNRHTKMLNYLFCCL